MPGNRPSFANSALRTISTSTWSGNSASLSFATILFRRGFARTLSDAMLISLKRGNVQYVDDFQEDFVLGNIKARQRMVAQYAIAGARVGVVIGTDHAAESLMGFFTKYGDGGADILPLAGLTKRRVRALAQALGAATRLAYKVPTADLESLTPQKPDEDSYGISYENIDDFLEGKPVSDEVFTTIHRFYTATRHKRALPVSLISTRP
jgi:NAD+ synthase